MVVNLKTCKINRNIHKLIRIFILINKKKEEEGMPGTSTVKLYMLMPNCMLPI
jgi:hypothetical protein